jgi:hypothetical protein
MVLMTAEGRRNITESQILCVDRPRAVGEHLIVTLYLLSGEQITGVVEAREASVSGEDELAG